MIPVFPSSHPRAQQAVTNTFRNQISTSFPSSSPANLQPASLSTSASAAVTVSRGSSSSSESESSSLPPASPTSRTGKMQAWSASSNFPPNPSPSTPGGSVRTPPGNLDVSIEDVYVYVSPRAILARAAKRLEREALEVQYSAGRSDKPPLRERPSFLNLNKRLPGSGSSSNQLPPTPGPWRRATLKLTEHASESRAPSYLLEIREENHITPIYLQNHHATDVRIVHRSLFHLKDCLGIYNSASSIPTIASTTPSSSDSARAFSVPLTPTFEPIYLHFPQPNTLPRWFSLFRACTRPETYGVQRAPISLGGLYRVSRDVEMTIVSGKNIGLTSSNSSSATHGANPSAADSLGNYGGSEKDRARKEVSSNLKSYGRIGYGGGANAAHVLSGALVKLNGSDGVDWTGASVHNSGKGRASGSSSRTKGFGTSSNGSNKSRDRDYEDLGQIPSVLEDDLFCAVYIAGELSACSSIQSGLPQQHSQSTSNFLESTPKWDQSFIFNDLPAFSDSPQSERSENNLMKILVYRVPSKKAPTLLLERFVPGVAKRSNNASSAPGSGMLDPSSTTGSGSASGPQTLPPSISPSVPAFDLNNHYPVGPYLLDTSEPSSSFVLLGKVEIPLASFRRGELVEGHWPIVVPSVEPEGSGAVSPAQRMITSGIVVGELHLKMKVDEDVILPLERYDAVYDIIKSQNGVSLSTELEKGIGRVEAPSLLPGVSSTLTRDIGRTCVARRTFVNDVMDQLSVEVADTVRTNAPLFRSSTMASHLAQRVMYTYGQEFVNSSVGPIVHQIIEAQASFETERSRMSEKTSVKDLTAAVNECIAWCQKMWESIYNHREECPQEMRIMLSHIRDQVDQQYAGHKKAADIKMLRLQSVTSFSFLRLIVPAIMDPYEYQITHCTPSHAVKRSLTQIGKIILSLSSLTNPTSRAHYSEEYQKPILEFISSNSHAINDYLYVVSTPKPPAFTPDAQQQLAQEQTTALSQLTANLPALHRESVPHVPQPFDLAKALASFCSTVARNAEPTSTRSLAAQPRSRQLDQAAEARAARLDALIARCFDIERDVAGTVAGLDLRAESDFGSRPRSPSSSSSSSTSSLSQQFQSFALSPAPMAYTSASPRVSHPRPIPSFLGSPQSSILFNERSHISPGRLEVSSNPLEPYQRITPFPDVPSFPSSSAPVPSSLANAPASVEKARRRSLVKSPSRGELGQTATRKRSGFLRAVLPGKRDG